jgi:threonine synthase
MGLPIGMPSFSFPTSHFLTFPSIFSTGKLVCATNKNDIVHRTLSFGDMSLGQNHPTLSPAMDIQFAYNLERLLYFISQGDVELVKKFMIPLETQLSKQSSDLPQPPSLQNPEGSEGLTTLPILPEEICQRIQSIYSSVSVSDEATVETIQQMWLQYRYPLCPHSAVGVYAATKIFPDLWSVNRNDSGGTPMVCVLTAHPSKFPEVFQRATGEMPPELSCFPVSELKTLPTRYEWLRQYTAAGGEVIDNWRELWIKAIKEKIDKL